MKQIIIHVTVFYFFRNSRTLLSPRPVNSVTRS
jgi:hypothetical protein